MISISTFIFLLSTLICTLYLITLFWKNLFDNKNIEEKINNLQMRTYNSGVKITQLSTEVTQLKNQIIILKEKIK